MSARAKSSPKSVNKELAAENVRLRKENEMLKQRVSRRNNRSWFSRSWRTLTIVVLAVLAGSLLVAANILFWAGHTVVDSQSYKQTITPLVESPQVQTSMALYTTNQVFANNDVQGDIASVLPPRADFLAPTLTGQLKNLTQTTLQKVLASDKFQTTWININVKAHDSLLKLASSPAGQDGVINLNEIYQQLGASLQGTKLAFLANKQLPPKVGDITVLKSNKLHTLHVVSSNINTFKYVSLAIVIAFSALAVWLAERRLRLVISLSFLFAILMALSLIAFRLTASTVSSKVQPEYQSGVSSAASIILHPLALQTWTVLLLLLLVGIGAWLGGASHSAKTSRERFQTLLEGKAHQALFGKHENALTRFVGRGKRRLQLSLVTLIALIMLLIKLSPKLVILYGLLMLLAVIVTEILAAPTSKRTG